jgi:hypothetical protein
VTIFADPYVPDVALDQAQRHYLIVPPGFADHVNYLRTTSFIDVVFEAAHLDRWRRRILLEHFAAHPVDVAQAVAAAKVAEGSKSANLDELARQLHHEAGGDEGRDYGTELHEALRCALVGEPYTCRDERWAHDDVMLDLAAILGCLQTHGVTIDPQFVEAAIACHELQVAGRTDGITTPTATGRRIIDLKSGKSPDPVKWAMQLAVYAHCDHVVSGGGRDLTPLPADIDRNVGYVIHCPKGTAQARLWSVDLVGGWEDVQTAVAVHRIQRLKQAQRGVRLEVPVNEVQWRDPKAPVDPFAGMPDANGERQPAAVEAAGDLMAALEESVARAKADRVSARQIEGPSPADTQGEGPACATTASTEVTDSSEGGPVPVTPERRAWIVQRVRSICATTDAAPGLLQAVNATSAAHLLQAWWPDGVPTLVTEGYVHSDAEVDAIAERCSMVERHLELAFAAPDPEDKLRPLPKDHDAVVEMARRLQVLPLDLLDGVRVNALMRGLPERLTDGRLTMNDVAQLHEIVNVADAEHRDRLELVTCLSSSLSILGVPIDLVLEVAQVEEPTSVRHLTAPELERLRALVDALESGDVVRFDDATGAIVTDGAALLAGRWPNRRDALNAGKACAKAHGLDAPRSFDALCADPLLVAHLVDEHHHAVTAA